MARVIESFLSKRKEQDISLKEIFTLILSKMETSIKEKKNIYMWQDEGKRAVGGNTGRAKRREENSASCFISYVKSLGLKSMESMYPIIFTFESQMNIVLFDLFNDRYCHVIYVVLFKVEVFTNCVRGDIVCDVEAVVAKSCLEIVLSLSYILLLTFFASDKINNIFGGAV